MCPAYLRTPHLCNSMRNKTQSALVWPVHTPLSLYMKTKCPIFALISQPTSEHIKDKLLQGGMEGRCQDQGLAPSPPLLRSGRWAERKGDGRGETMDPGPRYHGHTIPAIRPSHQYPTVTSPPANLLSPQHPLTTHPRRDQSAVPQPW